MANVKPVRKLKLRDFIKYPSRYYGLADGLIKLPVPRTLRIGLLEYRVPQNLEEFSSTLVYGQRMHFAQPESSDLGVIFRYVAGYYYPHYTGKEWDEKKALQFGRKLLNCRVIDLFPIATHLVSLMDELMTRERKLLFRKPTAEELAAGIEKLSKFADLSAVIFLSDSFKIDNDKVMLLPYDDCLVRFMYQKEQAAYAERYQKVITERSKVKGGKK